MKGGAGRLTLPKEDAVRFLKFDGSELGALTDDLETGVLWLADERAWSEPSAVFAAEVRSDERAVELGEADAASALSARGASRPSFA